jgi:dephospho-CoA kinase|tara:strand:+ start:12680 stop:13225 length:546 start_codon:yes stop_codon:yes gene_type:complete
LLPKLLIVGHGRHGKDTVCELLENYNYSFQSSSKFCSELFIFNDLKDQYNYKDEEACYADRHNHRTEWYNMIHNYCKDDLAKLGRNLFAKHDIYCGLRNKREFFAMQNEELFDYAIWVDRTDHLPSEDSSSMSIEQWMCDYTIDNNGDLKRLEQNVDILIKTIFKNQDVSLPASNERRLFA